VKTHPVFVACCFRAGWDAKEETVDIKAVVTAVLQPLGYELLELAMGTGRTTGTVLVRIDRLDETPVMTGDLERVSRVLGLEFDHLDTVHNLFPSAYKLDVESPGPKRPLTRQRHFERMIGLKIKIKQKANSHYARIDFVGDDGVKLTDEAGVSNILAYQDLDNGTVQAFLAEWPDGHR
jgi:ribosome maturation factor RimP